MGSNEIFCTGASGYIGGSVAAYLVAAGHQVTGLVRSPDKAEAVRARGIEPVLGTLDDARYSVAGGATPPMSSSTPPMPTTAAPSKRCSTRWPAAASPSSTHRDRASSARAPAANGRMPCSTRTRRSRRSPARAARVALNELMLAYREKGCRARHHLPEPDLRPRPRRQPAQRAGAVADRAREESAATPHMPAPAKTSGPTCISTIS